MGKTLLFILGSMFVSFCFLVIGYRIFMHYHIGPVLESAKTPLKVETRKRMLVDLKILENEDLFSDFTYTNNANSFLEQHIPWSSEEISSNSDENLKLLQHMFSDLSAKKIEIKDQITEIPQHANFERIDTDWMQDLSQYDHWNFYENNYFAEKVNHLKNQDVLQVVQFLGDFPVPEVMTFLNLSVVRFLKNVDSNKDEAYRSFHKSLQLLHSQGTLLSQTVAAKGVLYGIHFKEAFPTEGYGFYNWDVYHAYQRVPWGWVGLISKGFGPATGLGEFETYLSPKFGVCSTGGENLMGNAIFVEFTRQSSWPLEHNFKNDLMRKRQLTHKILEACHLEVFKPLVDRKPHALYLSQLSQLNRLEPANESATPALDFDIGKVPYLRRILWGILVSAGTPNFTSLYDNDRYEPPGPRSAASE